MNKGLNKTCTPHGLYRGDIQALLHEPRRDGVVHGAQLGSVTLRRSKSPQRQPLAVAVSVCHCAGDSLSPGTDLNVSLHPEPDYVMHVWHASASAAGGSAVPLT